MIRWSATWLLPSFLLLPVFFGWYMINIPSANRALLELGMTTIGTGAFTQVTRISLMSIITTVTVSGVVYFFAYKSPRDFTFSHALAVLGLVLVATGSTEYAREAIRKPYVIGSHMYSNGIRVRDVQKLNNEGFLTASIWTPKDASSLVRGKAMFAGQCLSCHTTDGYRSMKKLLAGRDEKAIKSLLTMLHENKAESAYSKYMPPLVGKPEEIEDLGLYLVAMTQAGQKTEEAKPHVATAPESKSVASAKLPDGAVVPLGQLSTK